MNNPLELLLTSPGPTIAASINNPTIEALTDARQYADVAELRLDLFAEHSAKFISGLVNSLSGMPVLLTLRGQQEGGNWLGTAQQRLETLTELVPYGDGIDIEMSAEEAADVVSLAHQAGAVAIASFHDFIQTPPNNVLSEKITNADEIGADYVKIAVNANHLSEYTRLKNFVSSHAHSGLIAVGMGEYGPRSRIELPEEGSHMTYGFVGGTAVAPGQVSCRQLREEFNHRHSFDEKRI